LAAWPLRSFQMVVWENCSPVTFPARPAIVVPAARLIHLSAWLRQAAGVFCSVAVRFMARP
jgi:hypothetical protein